MEEVVVEGDVLRCLEERGQRAVCATQGNEDKVKDEVPLLDCDIEVNCEGVVLDGW